MRNYKLILISVFIFAIILSTSLLYFENISQLRQKLSMLFKNPSLFGLARITISSSDSRAIESHIAIIKKIADGDEAYKTMTQAEKIAVMMLAGYYKSEVLREGVSEYSFYLYLPSIKNLTAYPDKLIALRKKKELLRQTKSKIENFNNKTMPYQRAIGNLQERLGIFDDLIISLEAEAENQKAELKTITDALQINTLIRELNIAADQLDALESLYSDLFKS